MEVESEQVGLQLETVGARAGVEKWKRARWKCAMMLTLVAPVDEEQAAAVPTNGPELPPALADRMEVIRKKRILLHWIARPGNAEHKGALVQEVLQVAPGKELSVSGQQPVVAEAGGVEAVAAEDGGAAAVAAEAGGAEALAEDVVVGAGRCTCRSWPWLL